jgi:hypothetical protein
MLRVNARARARRDEVCDDRLDFIQSVLEDLRAIVHLIAPLTVPRDLRSSKTGR